MTEFLGILTDPPADGGTSRSNTGRPSGLVFKAPPAKALPFAPRWNLWGSAYGGAARIDGDPNVDGSHNLSAHTGGIAAGANYQVSPVTMLGFALAGGGTDWRLAQGLGSGRSDAFQVGLYGATHAGSAYLTAALAFANNWFTTNRTALGDQLAARFQGQSYGGRLEMGYRLAVPVDHGLAGLTPYAGLQAQNFRTPSYGETDLTGGGFGLTYAGMTGTDTRGEFGARFDESTLLGNMPLILRARLAWAHDWVGNPPLNATFDALPGASFTVNGAPLPRNSALTSAAAQLFFARSWSLLAKFDGEFASGVQTYSGSGTLRYGW